MSRCLIALLLFFSFSATALAWGFERAPRKAQHRQVESTYKHHPAIGSSNGRLRKNRTALSSASIGSRATPPSANTTRGAAPVRVPFAAIPKGYKAREATMIYRKSVHPGLRACSACVATRLKPWSSFCILSSRVGKKAQKSPNDWASIEPIVVDPLWRDPRWQLPASQPC